MLLSICYIVFFGVFAINHFSKFKHANTIMAIAAAIIAVAMLIKVL